MPWFQALSLDFIPRALAFRPVSGREADGHAKVKAFEQPGREGGAVTNASETGDAREALDGMPAEVDFSESLPNPYVGKARRRVDATTDNGTHRRVGEDQWRDPLHKPSSSFQRQGH